MSYTYYTLSRTIYIWSTKPEAWKHNGTRWNGYRQADLTNEWNLGDYYAGQTGQFHLDSRLATPKKGYRKSEIELVWSKKFRMEYDGEDEIELQDSRRRKFDERMDLAEYLAISVLRNFEHLGDAYGGMGEYGEIQLNHFRCVNFHDNSAGYSKYKKILKGNKDIEEEIYWDTFVKDLLGEITEKVYENHGSNLLPRIEKKILQEASRSLGSRVENINRIQKQLMTELFNLKGIFDEKRESLEKEGVEKLKIDSLVQDQFKKLDFSNSIEYLIAT
jgi:hypothetical protein